MKKIDRKKTEKANQLQNQIVYHIISKALILASELNLEDHISSNINCDELAKRLGYHPEAAKRLFKLLESLDLLEIANNKLIKPTPLTPFLKKIYSEHFFGSFIAFNYFEHALKSNKECWSNAFGTTFYNYIQKDKKKLNLFQLYLEETGKCWLNFIPSIFDFSMYENIVDIGGGTGQLLGKILEVSDKHERMKGILFERAEVIATATDYISSNNLKNSISLVSGDFLKDDLPEGDIYLLCRVLLNWSDQESKKIIEQCLKKMTRSKDQKLIIVDFLIPQKKHKHYQRAILHDLNLLAVFGGKIRTLADWKDLINSVNNVQAKYKIIDGGKFPELNVPAIFIEITRKH